MYYHPERKLIYLAHPRTASSATANALLGVGFKCFPGQQHHDGIPPEAEQAEDRREYRVFTTVRNPWDTVISWMFFLEQEPPFTLEDLEREVIHKRLSGYFRDGRLWWFLKDADLVVRYETLERDLGRVLRLHSSPRRSNAGVKVAQIPPLEVPEVNVGDRRAGRPYQELYTGETREWVAETLQEDIEATGYSF